MKIVLIFLLCCTAFITTNAQKNVYSFTIIAANEQQYSLSSDSGKIIWVVVLPVMQTSTDTAFLLRIDSISKANGGQIFTIGVPSYDDGYVPDSSNRLMSWYQNSLNSNIIISKPLFTHKSAGSQQDSLFQWLTNVSMNRRFDNDITGPRSFLFINAKGDLYAELSPLAAFSDKALRKVLNEN